MTDQAHSKFKVFIANPYDTTAKMGIAELAEEWARTADVAPKSIGVEYLEAASKVVLSLGYRDDEPGYPIILSQHDMGVVEIAPEAIEKALSTVANLYENVICHEFYIDDKGALFIIVMRKV